MCGSAVQSQLCFLFRFFLKPICMLNLTPGPMAPCWDCNRLVCSGIEVRGQGVSDLNREAYSCRTTHRKQTITHHLQRRRNPGQHARVCVGVCVLWCPRDHTQKHTSEDQHTHTHTHTHSQTGTERWQRKWPSVIYWGVKLPAERLHRLYALCMYCARCTAFEIHIYIYIYIYILLCLF